MANDTRERILASAVKIVEQKGILAATAREITADAGVNLALLNYHFKSKDKLYEAVVAKELNQFFSHLLVSLRRPGMDTYSRLCIIMEAYFDYFGKKKDMPYLIASIASRNPEAYIGMLPVAEMTEFLSEYLKTQDKIDSERMTQMLWDMIGFVSAPFLSRQVLQNVCSYSDEHFNKLLKARRAKVPEFVKDILER